MASDMHPRDRAMMEGRYNALHRAYTDTGTLSPEAWSEMSSIYERLSPIMEAEAAQYEAETQPAIRAYTPTTQEAVAGYIGDRLSGVLPNSSYRVGHRVSNLLDLLPGTGTLMAGDQARRDYNEGRYGSAALNAGFAALDALPFVGAAARSIPSDAVYAGRSLLEGDPRGLLEAVSPTRPRQSLSAMRPETSAQQTARLLREGRGAEVTDDLYAAADPQELHRLYEAGATGADMPMDTTSRMARADEIGFDARAYHGTGADFTGFDADKGIGARQGTGVFSSNSPKIAETYAPYNGGRVLPIMRRADTPIVSADGAAWNRLESPVYALDTKNWEDIELIDEMGEASTNDIARAGRGVVDALSIEDVSDIGPRRYGFDSYPTHGTINIDYDPSNIRSRFARFDPRLAHLRNLSSGVAGAGAVGLGLLSQQPSQSEVEQYLTERGLLQ